MRRSTINTISAAVLCAGVGVIAAAAVTYTFDHDANVAGSQTLGSTFRALTVQEIDVLAEGDLDRRWETCMINTDYAVSCPDGTWHEYAPPVLDGSITDRGAFAAAMDLDPCNDAEATTPGELPCRVSSEETYAVGGDGTVHDGCVLVVTTTDDAEMVCRDDTVWAS
jgi:hypothetical protein